MYPISRLFIGERINFIFSSYTLGKVKCCVETLKDEPANDTDSISRPPSKASEAPLNDTHLVSHNDTITAIAITEYPDEMILSAARDGAVRIYR